MSVIATSRSIRPPAVGKYFEPPAWGWAQAGDVGWWVRPGWEETLLGPEGLRLEEWERAGRLRTVKAGPHRVVYRADLPDGVVYIKHFLVPNLRALWRQWFRRGKGRNEAKRAAQLAAAGVPTFQTIALGERRYRKFLYDNYLVTREVPDSAPLDTFILGRLPQFEHARYARLRRRLAEKLGELTARLHDGGFVHIDFHPGNILVRLDSKDEPSFAMIDLDALRDRRQVDEHEAMVNLALLNHYFWERASRTDRFRFLRSYARSRRETVTDIGAFARGIERQTRAWAERLWRRWGRRCLGDGKYFTAYQGPRTWAVAANDLTAEEVRENLRDPDAPFARPDAVLIKHSRTTTVAKVELQVSGIPTKVIYKRFNRKKLFDPIYTLFRPSRAWRAWCNGQNLVSRGLPTPRNLLVIGRTAPGRRFLPSHFLPRDTYLATLEAKPAISLGAFVRQVLPALPPAECRARVRALALALARLIKKLHRRSLRHRDLKADNILIEGSPSAAEPCLSLIDLVGVRIECPVGRRHRVHDLARLQVSLATATGRTRTDGLRFLRAYLAGTGASRDGWKLLWREIETACRQKEDRNRRNRRELS